MIFFSNRGWLGTGFAILMFLILSIIITSMGRKIIINSGRTVDSMREKQAYWNARVGRSVVDREGEEGQGIIEFGGGTVFFDDLCVIGKSSEVVSGGSVITLQSDNFAQGGDLVAAHISNAGGCSGVNQSPQLNWSGVPEDAVSLVIIVSDADDDNSTHWAIYGIPVATTELQQNAQIADPAEELVDYTGPCPPQGDGNHRYVFKIYALNASIDGVLITIEDLKTSMEGKIIACGQITGRYERP